MCPRNCETVTYFDYESCLILDYLEAPKESNMKIRKFIDGEHSFEA